MGTQKSMKVILDTNVFLSALLSPHGFPDRIYQAWRSKSFEIVTSSEQLDEIRRASRYPKFRLILQPAKVGTMINNLQRAIVLKVKGVWHYLYRAVDKEGNTVDFMLSKKRDTAAANAFFDKAIGSSGLPETVTIDKSGANKAGIAWINFWLLSLVFLGLSLVQIAVRQIKYLNNIVEQGHRSIKRMTEPMMGFKGFDSAEATLAGIELHRMLRKNQHIKFASQTIFEQFYGLAA